MAKTNQLIQRLDKSTLQTIYREELMSSKNKHTWAIHKHLSPFRYEVDKTDRNLIKYLQNHAIRGQTAFEIELQTFP